MNRVMLTVLNLVWGLWLGGLVMLFIAVSSLFKTFADDHALAGNAAANIFGVFNGYRLGLIAVALMLTAAVWIRGRTWASLWTFICFALGATAAFASTAVLTPRIDALRLQGLTHSADFARLHGLSMAVYLAETLCAFVGGLILANIRRPAAV